MNSYPNEFLAHPQPLMFVAGLSEASASISSTITSRDRSESIVSTDSFTRGSRTGSLAAGSSTLDPHSAAGSVGLSLHSPLTSPGPSTSPLPTSPPNAELAEELDSPDGVEEDELSIRDKEFQGLVKNLREALTPAGSKNKFWQAEKERKDFRILLVDKAVRLPLRKVAVASSDPTATPHSPLSPLQPTSPLHPDGLIAPVWIRKHADLIPSVFVLFLRLWEPPIPREGDSEDQEEREKRDRAKEKEMDDLLIREIGDRRRRLGERGIKLTVVLMASTETLDSPSLDPRLSYLRRSSALSSKASLFVLTPVPAEQLPDFVQSLQDALYDSAIEYYGQHAKRVKRKRTKVVSTPFHGTSLGEKGKSLGSQGWAVRYDWKSGWFAEIRGEFEVARKHYEDCWNELARMFASTTTLPPRTKRWAEAKVLADCVAMRICKLLLYEGEASKVTGPFFVHVKRFSDLSRGWGIGEETFEFWSWIARQYRIFGEMLEMAIASGLKLPPLPTPIMPTSSAGTGAMLPEHFATPTSSANPLHVLQQPAFYFYTAAICSVQRQKRYQAALDIETDAMASEAGSTAGYVATAPGFANEKKVDHAAVIIELFTKSYTLLKDRGFSHDRAALYVAFRIAETYCQSGQQEMAMRFFERISPSFKKDKWEPITREIRSLWYDCAQRTGNVETAARILIEMMAPESGVEGEERDALQDDLLSLLRTTTPSSTEPLILELDSSSSMLEVTAGFWGHTATLPAAIPYQVVLRAKPGVDISSLEFDSLHLGFSDYRPEVVVKAETTESSSTAFIDVGGSTSSAESPAVSADLTWKRDGLLVFSGSLTSDVEAEVQVTSVRLLLKEQRWDIQLKFEPSQLEHWTTLKGSVSPVMELSPIINFITLPPAIKLDVTHRSSAFVGEAMPISVSVSSTDNRPLDVELSAFIHPGEVEDGATIQVEDDEKSTSLTKAFSLGTIQPHQSISKSLYLRASGAGSKNIDISITSTIPSSSQDSVSAPSAEEQIHTTVIPVLEPFEASSTVQYNSMPLSTTGSSSGVGRANVSTTLRSAGMGDITVKGIQMKPSSDVNVKMTSHSLSEDAIPQTWNQDVIFQMFSQFQLASARRSSSVTALPDPCAELLITWKSAEAQDYTETSVPLPVLVPPAQQSFVSSCLTPPPEIRSHEVFTLPLTLVNSHPTHSIPLAIEIATAEAFVWRGDRVVRLTPELAAGETRTVYMDMVAVGHAGWVALPKVSVWEDRGEDEDRKEVPVLDGRDTSVERRGGNEGLRVFVNPPKVNRPAMGAIP